MMLLYNIKAEQEEMRQELKCFKRRFDPSLEEVPIITDLNDFDCFEARVKKEKDFRNQVVCV